MRTTTALSIAAAGYQEPVQGFLSSLLELERHARRIRRMSMQSFVDILASSDSEWASGEELVGHIGDLTHTLDLIRKGIAEASAPEVVPVDGSDTSPFYPFLQNTTLISAAQIAARLGWTRQALKKALAARRVFFVELRGQRLFPSFFTESRYERKQLEAVSKILDDLPGGSKLQFFTMPKTSLSGETPLDALAGGKYSCVRTTAIRFAQR